VGVYLTSLGAFCVYDPDGSVKAGRDTVKARRRVLINYHEEGGSLVVFNKTGEEIVQLRICK